MIEQREHLHEITVNVGPGGFVGARCRTAMQIVDGDEVIAERYGPTRPITREEVEALIGENNAVIIEAADTARAEAKAAEAERDAAVEAQSKAEAERDAEIAKAAAAKEAEAEKADA